MTVKILRWKPGSGGDTLIRLITLSNKNIKSNLNFDESQTVNDRGATVLSFDSMKNRALTDVDLISLDTDICGKVNLANLKKEIKTLESSGHDYILKSHYYDTVDLNNLTIDLLPSYNTLPFVIIASLKKTNILSKNFSNITKIIRNEEVLKKYTLYSLAVDFLRISNLSGNKILIDDIICSWDSLKLSLEKHQIYIDMSVYDIYNSWLTQNSKYFPSQIYLDLIKNKRYDYQTPELTLSERYSLLAIAGEKFKILN